MLYKGLRAQDNFKKYNYRLEGVRAIARECYKATYKPITSLRAFTTPNYAKNAIRVTS